MFQLRAWLLGASACLFLAGQSFEGASAENRVGDADLGGLIEMNDAEYALQGVLGTVSPGDIIPLTLVESTDTTLDIGDVMLIAQAANGQATGLSGPPAGFYSLAAPPAQAVNSGDPPFILTWDVASLWAAAGWPDDAEVVFTITAGVESTLGSADPLVSGAQASVEFTPLNTTGSPQGVTVELQIQINTNDGAPAVLHSASVVITVNPPVCGDGMVSAPEQCDPAAPGTNCCDPVTCQFTALDAPDPQGVCTVGDSCQAPVCDGAGACTALNLDGNLCDDGDACTQSDTCSGGSCSQAAPVVCDDGDACTMDSCDTLLGCQVAPVVCDDGDACTTDSCDTLLGCQVAPVVCDDGDACTMDSCDTLLGCQVAPVVCDDGDACTMDSCDMLLGCQVAPVVCDDGDACTTDSCDMLLGCQVAPVVCDDGDACTTDSCDMLLGCQAAPVVCDDGDACTMDSCDMLLGCQVAPVVCDDGDACTTDSCDMLLGCQVAPVNCDDGQICTGTETCDMLAGCLAGTPEPPMTACGGGNVCDGAGACVPPADDIDTLVTDTLGTPDSDGDVGDEFWVTCLPTAGGLPAPSDPVSIDISGPSPVTLTPQGFYATVPGIYTVTCMTGAPSNLVDATPTQVTINIGPPVSLVTEVAPTSVTAGETAQVTCRLFDAYNNEYAQGVYATDFTVTGSPGGSSTTSDITPHFEGYYDITCIVPAEPGLMANTVSLEVLHGPAYTVDYVVNNPLTVYPWSYGIDATPTAYDEFGNWVWDATFTYVGSPIEGVNSPYDYGFQLYLDGYIDVYCEVTSATKDGLPVISPTQTFLVDGQPPVVNFSITRADQLLGSSCGSPSMPTITGTVDDLSTVVSLNVNGSPVAFDGFGNFSFNMTPQWGLNIIYGDATDSFGFINKFARSFLWSPTWLANPDINKFIDDALRVRLQQIAVDDNEVNIPDGVDDLAEIAHRAVSGLNVDSLLAGLSISSGSSCPIDYWFRADSFNATPNTLNVTSLDLTIINATAPADGGLALAATTGNIQIDFLMDYKWGCVDFFGCGCLGSGNNVPTRITLTNVSLTGNAIIDYIPASGFTDVYMTGVNASASMTITCSSYICDIINLFGLDDDIRDMVLTEVEDMINTELPPLLESALNGLQLAFDLDLTSTLGPNSNIHLLLANSGTWSNTSCPNWQSGTASCLELDLQSYVYLDAYLPPLPTQGAILQCTNNPPVFEVTTAKPFQAAIDHDFLNLLFHQLWATGDLSIDITTYINDALADLGIAISAAQLDLLVPPVIDYNGSNYKIGVGDIKITLEADFPGVLPPGAQIIVYASGILDGVLAFSYLGNCAGGDDVGLRCPSTTTGGVSDCPGSTCTGHTDQLVVEVITTPPPTLYVEAQVPIAPVGSLLSDLVTSFTPDLVAVLPDLLTGLLPSSILPEIDLYALAPTIFPPGTVIKFSNVILTPGLDFSTIKGTMGN